MGCREGKECNMGREGREGGKEGERCGVWGGKRRREANGKIKKKWGMRREEREGDGKSEKSGIWREKRGT